MSESDLLIPKMKMVVTLLVLCVQMTSILSEPHSDVPQPTLVCRGLGCSEALSQPPGPGGLTQQRLGQFGPIQTCFFNRCQISGPGFFASQSCFGGPCSQTFSSSSSFSSPTRAFYPEEAISPNINSTVGRFSGGNIFGSEGLFAQIFGKKR